MADDRHLSRQDTTKGPPLRVLSLDGGGIRGYSMLIILQELMHRMFVEIHGRAPKRSEIPKPCDHFDLIAGTGTGGLIAIMLGRLRLDLDTCKDLYVRLTRKIFETDKTIAGIPIRSTMFKASKLEEAIKECVREHTLSEQEGNDSFPPPSPSAELRPSSAARLLRRSNSTDSRYSLVGASPTTRGQTAGYFQWGNADTPLYDKRENRTKMAVVAMLQGTAQATLLRSYDSRKETAPEVNCSIWQAGRATTAIQMAFKPMQIGQTQYLDSGRGQYNPAPLVLDEAVVNEWPGREVGVMVSVGTGKRPRNSSSDSTDWWEGLLKGTSMGDFAEARKRLGRKLEACEDTHNFMLREHLAVRGVNKNNYYRFNVEVGVGEFALNEWNRLAEISTNTRLYLARRDVETSQHEAAVKLARINASIGRHQRNESWRSGDNYSYAPSPTESPRRPITPARPGAVELPADDGHLRQTLQPLRPQRLSHDHGASSGSPEPPPLSSARTSTSIPPGSENPGTPGSRLPSYEPRSSPAETAAQGHFTTSQPPPIPPKSPQSDDSLPNDPGATNQDQANAFMDARDIKKALPYPDVPGPPPVVNFANKPQYYF